jgi:hypothetical protein
LHELQRGSSTSSYCMLTLLQEANFTTKLQCIFPSERPVTSDLRTWSQGVDIFVTDMKRWRQEMEVILARHGVSSHHIPPTPSTSAVPQGNVFRGQPQSTNKDSGHEFMQRLAHFMEQEVESQVERRITERASRFGHSGEEFVECFADYFAIIILTLILPLLGRCIQTQPASAFHDVWF